MSSRFCAEFELSKSCRFRFLNAGRAAADGLAADRPVAVVMS